MLCRIALAQNGTRLIWQESLPVSPELGFDAAGNALVLVTSVIPNLATFPDAPLRAGCNPFNCGFSYGTDLRRVSTDGRVHVQVLPWVPPEVLIYVVP